MVVWALTIALALLVSCQQVAGPAVSQPDDTPPHENETAAPEPVRYRAAANGVNGQADSTLILFNFDEDVADLNAADISLVNGGGAAYKGALAGSGKEWSLDVAVLNAGSVTVAVHKEGIEEGEKPVALYKTAQIIRIGYNAVADGDGDTASSIINFTFGAALAELSVGDITLADSTGSAFPMELFGGGQEWSLGIAVIRAGDIRVSINREGIEAGEHILTLYMPEEDSLPAPEKTGLVIISPPDITLYARNQPFDPTGLVVGWEYSDGTIEVIPSGGYQLSEPNMSQPTLKKVTVQAGGYTASFWIQALSSDQALVSISVSGPANKIQEFGREFDRTGLVVTGHYSDDSTSNLTSLAAIVDYDKHKRGPQAPSVKLNGKTAPLEGIVTRIGSGAALFINRTATYFGRTDVLKMNYKDIYVKGEAITFRGSNIQVGVSFTGYASGAFWLTPDNGGVTEADFATLSGYNPYQAGWQLPSITVDGRELPFHVRVIDTEPAVWFDYGYMRHDGDPTGHGPGAGKYYAQPNETLVIAPVRYLLGYNADHSDSGASWSWTVSGDDSSRTYAAAGNGGELLRITPKAAGTYSITVSVTGRDYVTGSTITKTDSTELVCYAGALTPGTFASPLKNFAPGQFTTGGSGYGWSLGAAGGYEVWTVEPQSSYTIRGNAFSGWHEPGVVWLQEDNNGNGLPDEMWYELRGPDDDDYWRDYITRRYAIHYVKGDGTAAQHGRESTLEELGRRAAYWVDVKGRAGILPGGFPNDWGVTGNWATYTGTLIRDDGNITGGYSNLVVSTPGYADSIGETFYVDRAMGADGASVTLGAVKFIKVQTGILRYGGMFGEVSTEIRLGSFLDSQSDFPDP
jgi:hypothetical protein